MAIRRHRGTDDPGGTKQQPGDSAGLIEEAERRTGEMSALLEVSRVVASSLDLRDVLGAILDQLGAITEHTGASIVLFRGDAFEFAEARSLTGRRAQIGSRVPFAIAPGLTEVLKRGEAVVIDDVSGDGGLAADYRAIIRSVGVPNEPPFNVIRSWMAVPLALKDRVVGALTISWTEPAYFTSDHVRLARAFADQAVVAIENARLYEEMRSSARQFEALSRADSELFGSLDVDAVLQSLVDVTVDVLGTDKSMVTTWDVDARVMTLRASRNLGEPALAYIRDLFNRRTQSMDVPTIVVTDDISRAGEHLVPIIEWEDIRSMIEVPVVSRDGRPLGFFSVAYTTDHHFDEPEQRLLTALADRAAVAIGNAELHVRAQQVASLEERQRLARELHDSVSQALYGIALGARTARTQLARDPEGAAEPIEYVLSLAEAGMAEMRALIFELRPESLESEGLVAALGKQVAATQARYALTIDTEYCEEPDMPVQAKEVLYRIAQEALHNVVKHARAQSVRIQLNSGDSITLVVRDDGVGYDPGADYSGHLGLKSMRERAEAAGGSLSIESAPGEGSSVTASIPAIGAQ